MAGLGCGTDGPRTVYNADPARKIPAIIHAADAHDTSVIPELVKNLDSDDPAIRFYANRGLRDLTGQDFGYRYYEDETHRGPAVLRWKQWLANSRPAAVQIGK